MACTVRGIQVKNRLVAVAIRGTREDGIPQDISKATESTVDGFLFFFCLRFLGDMTEGTSAALGEHTAIGGYAIR